MASGDKAWMIQNSGDPKHLVDWQWEPETPYRSSVHAKGVPLTNDERDAILRARVVVDGGAKRIPDALVFGSDAFLYSKRLKTLIERFEPNAHEFIPVELTDTRRDKSFEYFYIRVSVIVDAVNRELTDIKILRDRAIPGYEFEHLPFPDEDRRTLIAERLAENHLWRDAQFNQSNFISNDLLLAMQQEGIDTFCLARCELL